MGLSYEDLLKEEEKESEEKGLNFTAKGGTKVVLRPVIVLPRKDQSLILTLAETLQKDELSIDAKLDAVDHILVAAADRKDPMKKSLADLSLKSKMRIFEEWMERADLPEAKPSMS